MEIEKDLGSEIHVFSCGCDEQAALQKAARETVQSVDRMRPFMQDSGMVGESAFEIATLNLWSKNEKLAALLPQE